MQRFGLGRRASDNSVRALIAATGLMLTVLVADGVSQSPEAAPPSGSKETSKPNEPPSKEGILNHRVADCFFTDTAGRQTALSDFRDKNFLVIVFMGTECPVGNMYVPELNSLQQNFEKNGVQFLGVNSNPGDTAEEIAAHAKKFEINFPVLQDPQQIAADCLKAQRTTEVFVLDSRRVVRYRGRIDDRLGDVARRDKATRKDLEIALCELTEGKGVSVAETPSAGCLITRRSRLAGKGEITYSRQVSRILQARCQECHHPGTAAPFALLDYDDAVNWSAMIKEVVAERRMPPWGADPRHGKFTNEWQISQEEIDTLVSWIDHGTPRGDDQELPPRREFVDGWRIGKPDVVFKMPQEYTVAATGTVRYQQFRTQTDFKEEMWIQAAEVRPGNRAVVHHVIVFYRDPKHERPDTWVAATAPGASPVSLPPGIGRRIPAGAELIWQVHYTPTGKVEKDQSEIGLVFCKERPQYSFITSGVANHAFVIQPGTSHHEVISEKSFSKDVKVVSLMPHMHLRGKDFEYEAIYPDGTKQTLLSVPSYDFNWQNTYRLEEPLKLPEGAKIRCVAHFDNSAANPANPDPGKSVRWGDQTWEEMMIGYVDYIEDEPLDVSSK